MGLVAWRISLQGWSVSDLFVVLFHRGKTYEVDFGGLWLPVIPYILWRKQLGGFVGQEVPVEVTLLLPGCHDPVGFVCQDGHVAHLGELVDFLDQASKHGPSVVEIPFSLRDEGC